MSILSTNPKTWIDKLYFQSPALNKHLVRCMDLIANYGGTVAECLTTANAVESEDEVSWYEAWKSTADRVSGIAEKALSEGHLISARQTFLRASMYYRAAGFYMLSPEHLERGLEAAFNMKKTFLQAMNFLDYRVEQVKVPFEKTTLPCYFYTTPRANNERMPVIILSGGIDDTAEELHFKIASAAVSRGYNVLILQGPGQGQALYEQGLKLRHNWETVITPVIDYILTRDEVDSENIIVYGNSFSGGLVARAAAFEHRPKAYILNSGLYSFADWLFSSIPPQIVSLLNESPEAFDNAFTKFPAETIDQRIRATEMTYKMGIDKASDLFTSIKKFAVKDVVGRIKSHMLIIDGEDEIFTNQSKQLYDNLNCEKTWMYFSREDIASLHCQSGNREISNQRIFDWLDNFLKKSIES